MKLGVWDGVLDIGTDGSGVGVTVGAEIGCEGRDCALVDPSEFGDEVTLESSSMT